MAKARSRSRRLVRAAPYLLNYETDGSQPHEGLALGSANTEGTSCDLLLFALPSGQGLEIWKEMHSGRPLIDLPVALLTSSDGGAARFLDFAKCANNHPEKDDPEESARLLQEMLHLVQTSDRFDSPVEVGELLIDPCSYQITRAGKQTTLPALEFRFLYYLAARPNRVFTREQLYGAIWHNGRSGNPRVLRIVDVYIRRLRMKIEPDPEHPVYLKTLRGMGYSFESTCRSELLQKRFRDG